MQNSKLKFSLRFFSILLSFSTFYLLLATHASAQSNTITVSPQLIQLDLSTDQAQAVYSYTNSTDQTVELTLSMQDVKELEDRGIPSLLDQNDAKNYKYGLSSWATFSNKNLVIAPTETKKVTVFINKTRLSQGGHYASVLAEIKQLSEGKTVKLRAILSSLLFVRTGSDSEKEEGNITSILHESNYLAYPSAITFRLQNTGNVDLIPYGLVTVSDPYGRQVSRSAVNENSLITLPDSIRKYVVVIKNDRFLPPGFYTAKVELTVGKKKIKIVKEERFFSLGSMSMKSISVILIVLIGGGIIALKIPRRREVN